MRDGDGDARKGALSACVAGLSFVRRLRVVLSPSAINVVIARMTSDRSVGSADESERTVTSRVMQCFAERDGFRLLPILVFLFNRKTPSGLRSCGKPPAFCPAHATPECRPRLRGRRRNRGCAPPSSGEYAPNHTSPRNSERPMFKKLLPVVMLLCFLPRSAQG